jgi:CRISPR-associated protein Cas2
MGWLFVCFDLPVQEKWQVKEASRFRKKLLDLGYFMLQNSVYVRNCVSYEKTEQHTNNVRQIAPSTGSICIFYLTDKQWGNSITIEKADYRQSKYSVSMNETAPKQITFW